MSKLVNEPKIEDSYEIHIKALEEGKEVWYRWTGMQLAEVNYYTEGEGAELIKRPEVMGFKVVVIEKSVTRHWMR